MSKATAPTLLLFIGFILLACGGVMAWHEYRQPAEAVVMECDPVQYNSLAPQQTATVQFTLTNRSSVPARVVGLAPC